MVDALDSGSSGSNAFGVQVPGSALFTGLIFAVEDKLCGRDSKAGIPNFTFLLRDLVRAQFD